MQRQQDWVWNVVALVIIATNVSPWRAPHVRRLSMQLSKLRLWRVAEIGFASFSRQVRADPAWLSLGLAASACGTSAEAGAPYRAPSVVSRN
jgi:hypothetical protein